MNSLRICIFIIAGLVLLVSPTVAERVEHVEEILSEDGIEELEIQIDFGAGVIEITTEEMEEAAKLDIFYSPRYVDYETNLNVRDGRGRMFLESEISKHHWDDNDFENEWNLTLSKKYPTSLDLDIGACKARFDLSGIPLVDLQIDVGAADLEIEFNEPNPGRLRELNIDCGASSLEIIGLANARAEMMDFDIGAGSCEIDLRGEIEGEVEVDIDVGVGSMDVIISRDIAVMIRGDDDWFSSLDFHGMRLDEVRDGVWMSEDFDEAEDRIVFTVDVSMGSVDIYARR
ncbi:MAG: hypothetical protein J7J98_04265 [candidate division Zixibacteria bacterium]|nr:hypothetical protein [candidate division Zixibacteria bacterium]